MGKSKQESVSDWMELAKAFDKAEKETIQPYVVVDIEDTTTKDLLYRYDLPRDMFWKYEWVIEWRRARYICQRPRHKISCFLTFYDKKTGLEFGFGSLLSKMTSAKSQITMLENRLAKYKELMKEDLFFDETKDPNIAKFRCKIEAQRQKITDYENEIKNKLSKEKKNENN